MEPSGMDYADLDVAIRTASPDVLEVARGVGASAARLGAPLQEVLDHLERSHGSGEPSYELVRHTVTTFVETLQELFVSSTCEDPLTGWASLSHLRTALSGVYRAADHDEANPRQRYALVVVEPVVAERHPLARSLRAIDIAEALRGAFGRDEVFARVAADRYAVLTERSAVDDAQLQLITLLLRRALGSPEPRLWVELLPSREADLDWVLGGLAG